MQRWWFQESKTDWQKLACHVMFASRIITKVGPKILFTSNEHSHHKAKQQSSCVSHTPAQMEAVYMLSSLIKIADSFTPKATNSANWQWVISPQYDLDTLWAEVVTSGTVGTWSVNIIVAVATAITNRFEESWKQTQIVLWSSQHWLTTSQAILQRLPQI